ncbi:proteasome accessory factor A [Nesterenkonia xinjiangensis]|uniref:Proteasome accessory factor A n=2 Tax=Nesterenkonia xinjiangensis TaxID=225327 RepID=A0A7Z0KBL4_9MICC|nr:MULTISPECIES: depupylase/deamidase Dop [Nesterenkonia]MDZ5077980.1 depupylase/deamidase Dop [Nesterenkonia sp. HG001]NYJ79415.1 proteasome accessory factor A [Nesterenkonia xinjiangensis]
MSVRRLIGMETEYGIHAPQNPRASHVALSIELVNAYAAAVTEEGGAVAGTEWDYQSESPLVDARGWVLPRSAAHASQLTDTAEALDGVSGGDPSPADVASPADVSEGQQGHGDSEFHAPGSAHWRGDFFRLREGQPQLLMNLVLSNGARLYVDHAHPEYSAPETIGARRAVLYDVAGDVIVRRAAQRLADEEGSPELLLYKNNTDGKSVSYGAHENYLVPREVPFDQLVAGLIPFFVTRQIICGAGRLGIGQRATGVGFQISQRADFFEEEVGLETTVRRPIINTRDEPHADADRHRRLHVIIGDANMSEYSAWLRVGTTALVLDLIESGHAPQLRLHDPVEALKAISHDPSLTTTVRTNRGQMTALDIQRLYLKAAISRASEKSGPKTALTAPDTETAEILEAWGTLLEDLTEDVSQAADRVDWVAKLALMESYRRRDGLDWDAPQLKLIDLQYADLRPERGLYHKLVRAGRMRRLFSDEQIAWAAAHPPEETRAWLRGQLVAQHSEHLVGASWDQILLRTGPLARATRLSMTEPTRGSRNDAELVLLDADTPEKLVAGLTRLLQP